MNLPIFIRIFEYHTKQMWKEYNNILMIAVMIADELNTVYRDEIQKKFGVHCMFVVKEHYDGDIEILLCVKQEDSEKDPCDLQDIMKILNRKINLQKKIGEYLFKKASYLKKVVRVSVETPIWYEYDVKNYSELKKEMEGDGKRWLISQ